MSQTIWSLPLQSLSVFFLLSYVFSSLPFQTLFFLFSNLLFHKKNCSDTWHKTYNTHSKLTRKKERKKDACKQRRKSRSVYGEVPRRARMSEKRKYWQGQKKIYQYQRCVFVIPLTRMIPYQQNVIFTRKENVWEGLCLFLLIQHLTYQEKRSNNERAN